jgi:hypothetical protein
MILVMFESTRFVEGVLDARLGVFVYCSFDTHTHIK